MVVGSSSACSRYNGSLHSCFQTVFAAGSLVIYYVEEAICPTVLKILWVRVLCAALPEDSSNGASPLDRGAAW
jgi:hypothetical protein